MQGIKGFWDFAAYSGKSWFRLLSLNLVALFIIYIVLHFYNPKAKFEFIQLDADQLQQVNRIYFDTAKSPVNDTLRLVKTINDSLKKDSVVLAKTIIDTCSGCLVQTDSLCNPCVYKYQHVIAYLNSEFNGAIDPNQLNTLQCYLKNAKDLEAVGFLSKARLKVDSPFWLLGPSMFFEVIFWTLFGVLCSLLFNLGIVSRNSTNNPLDASTYYDSSEIPSQVAKILYAPLCTLVIVLGYNLFNDKALADISSGKGVIVFAFIGGFYSSRLIAFLDRLKEVLLPNSGKSDLPDTRKTPLKNVIIHIETADATAAVLVELSKTKITLTDELSGETVMNAVNLDKNKPDLFIADYLKPGKYSIKAELTITNEEGVTQQWTAEDKVEVKATDIYVTLQILQNKTP